MSVRGVNRGFETVFDKLKNSAILLNEEKFQLDLFPFVGDHFQYYFLQQERVVTRFTSACREMGHAFYIQNSLHC